MSRASHRQFTRTRGWRLHRPDGSSWTSASLATRKSRRRRRNAIAKQSRVANRV